MSATTRTTKRRDALLIHEKVVYAKIQAAARVLLKIAFQTDVCSRFL
jgi:hypothetical protein